MSDADYRIERESDAYTFIPTTGDDGIIDYTTVAPDKIYLANRKTILDESYPSYLPPVHIRRNTQYDIPAYKVRDNVYLVRESDTLRRDEKGNQRTPRIFRVSLDVYAALLNYHLEFDRASFTAIALRNEEARALALRDGVQEYRVVREADIPSLPEKFAIVALPTTYTQRYPKTENKPSRVALASTKSGRMNVEPYYFIRDMGIAHEKKLTRGEIFALHRECLNDVKQKILDMELQKADWESSWTKGRETSYGDSNLDDTLLPGYGIRVKRQNGERISKAEIEELKKTVEFVHSVFGNIATPSREFGLKVSHAGNTRMHASKYVGLFTPYYNAIGISFAGGERESRLTATHEFAHFMDHMSGKEIAAWHSSDIPGTLENSIAKEFRGRMNSAKGEYWSRTCECFARAIEEYAHVTMLREREGIDDFSPESVQAVNKKVSIPAFVDYLDFTENVEPMITTLLGQYRERFAREEEVVNKEKVNPGRVKEITTEIVDETNIKILQKVIYELAVEKVRLDKEAKNITEKINEERNLLVNQELRRISNEIAVIERQILVHNESGAEANSLSDLEDQKRDLYAAYNSIRNEFDPKSERLTEFKKKENKVATRLQEIEVEGKRLTVNLMELEKEEEARKKDEHEKKILNGLFTQLELFERAAVYSARERQADGQLQLFLEGDPEVKRDHIQAAKNAQRVYTQGILNGNKSGLWKSFRDFKKHGVFDIQGAAVATAQNGVITKEGWDQLYQALNIYRDKRFETFRVLFISIDGNIKDQVAISSHLPNRVNVSSLNGELGRQVVAYAEETNTKIVIAHNHPSGNIASSPEDESITRHLESTLKDTEGQSLLLGHIILDHDGFGLYAGGEWTQVQRNTVSQVDPQLKVDIPEFMQKGIIHPNILRSVAEKINESEEWNSDDWVPVLFTNGVSRISGIRYYSKEWVMRTQSEVVIREFQTVGGKTGSSNAFPILSRELASDLELRESVIEHLKMGCFKDFCIAGETAEEILGVQGRSFYGHLSRDEVLERTTVDSTFALEEQNGIVKLVDEAVASNIQGEYGSEAERVERLFRTDTLPSLQAALDGISKADIGKPDERIVITEHTPFVFIDLGFPNKSIEIYLDKIARSIMLPVTERHGHNNSITKENVLEVFSQLANPRAIFQSKDSISLVAVYDVLDAKNEPMMISLKNENNTIEVNLVTSVYGKPTRDIEYWLDAGRLLYVNDLDEKNAFMLPSRQLRMSNINAFTTLNVRLKSGIVNGNYVRQSESVYDENGGMKMAERDGEGNNGSTRVEFADGKSMTHDESLSTVSLKPREVNMEGVVFPSFVIKEVNDIFQKLDIDPHAPIFADGKSLWNTFGDFETMASSIKYDPPSFDGIDEYNFEILKKPAAVLMAYGFRDEANHHADFDYGSCSKGIDAFLNHEFLKQTYAKGFPGILRYTRDARERFLLNETTKDGFTHEDNTKKSYAQLNTERVLQALEAETAPFLRKNSEMDHVTLMPEAIRSAATGRTFRGMNQILAQIMILEIGGKDSELITYEQAKRHNAGIKKGSQGLTLTTYDVGTKVQKDYRYYPVSAVYNRENLPAIPAPVKNPGMIVSCIETTPEKYLGKYLAATSLGARFETTVDTMKSAARNLSETIQTAYSEKQYTKIFEIGNKASVICQNTMSEILARAREAERIQQRIVGSLSVRDPYNPVTGEQFKGMNGKKAAYVMKVRESNDPRFLELSDILKAGLSLKEAVKEPLVISDNGKARFFYNAKDIDGIPPMKEPRKIPLPRRAISQPNPNREQEMGL